MLQSAGLEKELSQTQSDLLAARAHGGQLHGQLRQTEAALERTEVNLSGTRAELAQIQASLVHAQAILSQIRADLSQARDDLARAEARSCETRKLLAGMESSKFWKLRKAWFRVRAVVRWAE
jgi:septal ring factor EnvC (AmiA/AmiB activator)